MTNILHYLEIPTYQNRVPESTAWRSRIPGHLKHNDAMWALHWIKRFHGRAEYEAHWVYNQQ